MLSRKDRAKIKELRKAEQEAAAKLNSQKTRVTAVATWLHNRTNQNGFGVDFEYTLRPRGSR